MAVILFELELNFLLNIYCFELDPLENVLVVVVCDLPGGGVLIFVEHIFFFQSFLPF